MASHFDRSAADWDKGDIRQTIARRSAEAIIAAIPFARTMKVMDFGAGTGLLSFQIAPLVASVSGVDTSAKMLEQLDSKNTPQLRVTPLLRDILDDPLEERFDAIVSAMAMHHVEDTGRFLTALYTHLGETGFIAIVDLESEDGRFHPADVEGVYHHGFDRGALAQAAEAAGFTNVAFTHVHTVLKPHGDYPIFLMTAQKLSSRLIR